MRKNRYLKELISKATLLRKSSLNILEERIAKYSLLGDLSYRPTVFKMLMVTM